jgi:hypothetical protein
MELACSAGREGAFDGGLDGACFDGMHACCCYVQFLQYINQHPSSCCWCAAADMVDTAADALHIHFLLWSSKAALCPFSMTWRLLCSTVIVIVAVDVVLSIEMELQERHLGAALAGHHRQ